MLKLYKTSVFKFLSTNTCTKNCIVAFSSKQNNETYMFYNLKTEPVLSNVCHNNFSNKFYLKPRQIWVENLDTVSEQKLGLITLNPNVFGMQPRVDIIHENIRWQKLFRFVSYANTKVRSEVRGGGRKPWPQKGLGKARHGSIRSPLWRKGGVVHGPRSPTSYFYMLPFYVRVIGLASILSIKLAQDDLHLVSELEFPNNESFYMKELIKKRNWGPSVLFIDNNDIVSQNVAIATGSMKEVNIIPVYGLNVYSLLKHDTIVVTEKAVKIIENKLLHHFHRIDSKNFTKQFKM